MYDRYRLLSSGDVNHFNIHLNCYYEDMCSVMNKLQSQAFQINSAFLKDLQENESFFVKNGLLMPKFLSKIKVKDVINFLRELYIKNEKIKKLLSLYIFIILLDTLCKNIQRSRYEQLIINLANAYNG